LTVHNRPTSSERPPAPSDPAPAGPGGPRRIRSEDLLQGGVELLIEHQGREYRLRVTQNGKLILTA
jgi:hemin uptake protein HemP